MPPYSPSPLLTSQRHATPPTPHRNGEGSAYHGNQWQQQVDNAGSGSSAAGPSTNASTSSVGFGWGAASSSSSVPTSVQWGATPALLPASVQWGSNSAFGGSSFGAPGTSAYSPSTTSQSDVFGALPINTPPLPDRTRKSESKRKRFDDDDADADEEMGAASSAKGSPSRERDPLADRIIGGRNLIPKRMRAGLGSLAATDTADVTVSADSQAQHQARFPDWRNSSAASDERASTTGDDGNQVDLGKMLASLDKTDLLSLLSSLLSLRPELTSTVHSLLPVPTLESVNHSLDAYEASIRQALPFGDGPIRPEYAWNRLRSPVGELAAGVQGWMEFFRAKQEQTSAQNQGVHPNTMFALLLTITARAVKIQRDLLPPVPAASLGALSGGASTTTTPRFAFGVGSAATALRSSLPASLTSPHSPNAIATTLLPLLLSAWDALLSRISQDINAQGKMFGREVVVGWMRGIEQLLVECDPPQQVSQAHSTWQGAAAGIDATTAASNAPTASTDGDGRHGDEADEGVAVLSAIRGSFDVLGQGFRREIGWVIGLH